MLKREQTMLFNLRFALRQLSKTPGFAFVAIATLAVGIGACTAMFSIIDAVLLKPLPFRQPDRLVWIENFYPQDLSGRTTRVDTFLGWREQNKSFESLAAYFAFFDYTRLTLTGVGDPERLRGVGISDNLLPTLGVTPLYGRNFTAEECRFNAAPTVILTNAFWRAHFQSDPKVIGRTISLNNAPATVVGVLPSTFDFAAIFSPGTEVGMLQPFPLAKETAAWGNTLFGIGRLRPGVTVAQAQDDLSAACTRLEKTLNVGTFGAVVQPLDGALRGKFRQPFLVLVGAVACILLIACVNLSNLLLARLNVRRQEFAVRIAVGARPAHLVAQTLTESLVLAVAGSALGIPLAVWTTAALSRLQTFGIPLLDGAAVDPTALAVTIGLTLFAGAACGIIPALYLAFGAGAAPGANQQRSASRGQSLLRDSLIVGEIALACVLLIGAGLLLRSFDSLLQVNLGFQPQHAMAWRMDPPRAFKSSVEADHYITEAVSRVAALPGVDSVGISDTLPLGRNRTWGAGEVGVQYPNGQYPNALPRIVDRNYLQTMQIPLLEGRYFDARDSTAGPKTVIVNQSLAHQLAPHGSALGKRLSLYDKNGAVVIGVVGDVRHSTLEERGTNEMYLDFNQCDDWSALEMVVRSSRPMVSLAPEVRGTLAAFDPMMPTGEYYELEKLVDDAVAPRRLITSLLGAFSIMALTLAALGLYGVIAFSVGQRTQEIGIRMAVGAQPADVLKLILGGGLRLIAFGVAIGIIAALTLGRLLEEMLYGVSAHDPAIFAVNAALITLVGVAACVLPALRASRVQPVVALRAG
jgi:putative ABC transport system permease protein